MTEEFAPPVEELISQFRRLPGVGKKSAQRLAFFVLGLPDAEAEAFASAIINAKKTVFQCAVCCNLTDRETCPVCEDEGRDHTTICVVADPKDVAAIERTREYKGTYHVLHGVISPLDAVGPDDIRIRELMARIAGGEVRELILATDPDTTGEATAMYIARLAKPFGVKVTRLAYGIPVGGHLEFADDVTLTRALAGRSEI
ncbi:MAG: recombination protein RecR [Clostridia bacterium]|nr:recombination protein RecR [Clostridia bacterium]